MSKVCKVFKWIRNAILVLILLVVLGGIATWSYWGYVNRPQPVYSLNNVSLGDSRVDVTIEHGSPDFADTNEKTGNEGLIYRDAYGKIEFLVAIDKSSSPDGEAFRICSTDYWDEVLGLGVYDSEDKVVKKLGEPEFVSINENGLEKSISSPEYTISIVIKKGDVYMTCVNSRPLKYGDEYDG